MTIRWAGYTDGDAAAYHSFARASFGPGAYQARPGYVDWLYRDHPRARGIERDFLIARTGEGEVVGCIHKMPLPWLVGGEERVIPAAHNLMVAEEHRSGLGLGLIMACFKGEDHVLVPGATAEAAAIYDRLGCQPVGGSTYRRVLRPARATVGLVRAKVLGKGWGPRRFQPPVEGGEWREGAGLVTADPEPALADALARGLNRSAQGTVAPYWDGELVRWRFFHAAGPRHVLIRLDDDDPLSNFLVVSLGPRRGLNVGRVIAGSADSAGRFRDLMAAARNVLIRAGSDVLLIFVADGRLDGLLRGAGWRPRPDPPPAFFHHRRGLGPFSDWSVSCGATDYGFEALPPDGSGHP